MNLFGPENAYGEIAARPSDPVTSHIAADRHERNGKRGAHAAIVLDAIRRHPSSTYVELWSFLPVDQQFAIGDAVEVMRRINDLIKSGTVRRVRADGKDVVRACRVRGSRMTVYEITPVMEPAQ